LGVSIRRTGGIEATKATAKNRAPCSRIAPPRAPRAAFSAALAIWAAVHPSPNTSGAVTWTPAASRMAGAARAATAAQAIGTSR